MITQHQHNYILQQHEKRTEALREYVKTRTFTQEEEKMGLWRCECGHLRFKK